VDLAYRLSQLWHTMTAGSLPPSIVEELAQVLSPAETSLFRQLPDSDQWHAYRVYRLLAANGYTDKDLLAAALLHDVGKAQVTLSAWDRSLAVLGERFAPQKAEEWGAAAETGWKRTFVIRKQHAEWGAQMAAQAGSSPLVIDLIRRHQDPLPDGRSEADELLALLQWADDQN
jgi:putative nucleotidyltransferase with HDIG domain